MTAAQVVCGEWVVTRRCERPAGHDGRHRNGDQDRGIATHPATQPAEPPPGTQQATAVCGLGACPHYVAAIAATIAGGRALAARPPADTETPPTLDDCTCDAFALTAERHRATCPIGRSWVLRATLDGAR